MEPGAEMGEGDMGGAAQNTICPARWQERRSLVQSGHGKQFSPSRSAGSKQELPISAQGVRASNLELSQKRRFQHSLKFSLQLNPN